MSGLPVVTPEQRRAASGLKLQVWGMPKIGKTYLASTLDPKKTLFLDCEKGMNSIRRWDALSLDLTSWEQVKEITCHFSGPDYGVALDGDYGETYYSRVCQKYGDPAWYSQFDTIFIDSTTLISQWALRWAALQPESRTDKGKPDNWKLYGLLGRELVAWAWRLQFTPRLNIILTGGLKKDDSMQWQPMIDGSSGAKFPYIFDCICTYAFVDFQDGYGQQRALIFDPANPWKYPAGNRLGQSIGEYERPNLQVILDRM